MASSLQLPTSKDEDPSLIIPVRSQDDDVDEENQKLKSLSSSNPVEVQGATEHQEYVDDDDAVTTSPPDDDPPPSSLRLITDEKTLSLSLNVIRFGVSSAPSAPLPFTCKLQTTNDT